jgi:hypothetical protein
MNPDLYNRLMDHHSHTAHAATKEDNEANAKTTSFASPLPTSTNKDEIYEYYKKNLIPALTSSLPLLLKKIKEDSGSIVYNGLMKVVHLLIPFTREDFEWHAPQVPHVATEAYGNLTQFLLNQFDSDHDGTCF